MSDTLITQTEQLGTWYTNKLHELGAKAISNYKKLYGSFWSDEARTVRGPNWEELYVKDILVLRVESNLILTETPPYQASISIDYYMVGEVTSNVN